MNIKIENILGGDWQEMLRSEVRKQILSLKAESDAKFEQALQMVDELFVSKKDTSIHVKLNNGESVLVKEITT
jgi:hypothetical protein